MTQNRFAGLAGVIFSVLFVIGVIMLGNSPDTDAPSSEWMDYLNDDGRLVSNIIGLYLVVVAGLAFLWFATHLRGLLRAAEGEPATITTFAFASAVALVAMLYAGGIALATVPAALKLGDASLPESADIARFLPQMGYGFIVVAGAFAAIGFILASSITIWRTGVLPQWVAWLGFLASLLLLAGVIFFPMIALPVWVLAVSIVLFTRPEMRTMAA